MAIEAAIRESNLSTIESRLDVYLAIENFLVNRANHLWETRLVADQTMTN